MATVLELAQHAGVSAGQVLRVLNGEAVSDDVAARVRSAVEALGAPPYPRRGGEVLPLPGQDARSVAERIAAAASELEERLPAQVGNVVYEAVRVEVRPVAAHVEAMEGLFRDVLAGLRGLAEAVAAERRDRVDDLALQVELIRSGWTSVDRRLGRLERMIERQQQAGQARTPGEKDATVLRFDRQDPAS